MSASPRARRSPRWSRSHARRASWPTPPTRASRSAPRSRRARARSSPAATSRTPPSASRMCAERVAVFKAVSEGLSGFEAIAVVADSKQLTAPCGPCRQILWEFCGDILVHMSNRQGAHAGRCACASCCRCPSTAAASEHVRREPAAGPGCSPRAATPGAASSTRCRPSSVVALLLDEDRRAIVGRGARATRRSPAPRAWPPTRSPPAATSCSSAPAPAAGWRCSRRPSARRPSARTRGASAR